MLACYHLILYVMIHGYAKLLMYASWNYVIPGTSYALVSYIGVDCHSLYYAGGR